MIHNMKLKPMKSSFDCSQIFSLITETYNDNSKNFRDVKVKIFISQFVLIKIISKKIPIRDLIYGSITEFFRTPGMIIFLFAPGIFMQWEKYVTGTAMIFYFNTFSQIKFFPLKKKVSWKIEWYQNFYLLVKIIHTFGF